MILIVESISWYIRREELEGCFYSRIYVAYMGEYLYAPDLLIYAGLHELEAWFYSIFVKVEV